MRSEVTSFAIFPQKSSAKCALILIVLKPLEVGGFIVASAEESGCMTLSETSEVGM